MSDYLYYPGCSMEGSGRSYRESLEAICEPLGITLDEIDDWNCCGATEYVSLSTTPAYAMIARNLAIAAGEKKDGESARRRLQRLLPQPGQGRPLHGASSPRSTPASTTRSAPAACTTTRAPSRSATCSRSSSTTSAWTRSRRR